MRMRRQAVVDGGDAGHGNVFGYSSGADLAKRIWPIVGIRRRTGTLPSR